MDRQIVVGVSGAINSGKSTFSRSLATQLGAANVRFGQLVKAIAIEEGLGTERSILQELGARLLADLGAMRFVDKALAYSDCKNHKNLVFDGVRHIEVWHAIKQRFGNDVCTLIFLEISPEIRQQRVSTDGIYALHRFDQHSTERQVWNQLGLDADVRINAEKSVDAMVDTAIAFLSR